MTATNARRKRTTTRIGLELKSGRKSRDHVHKCITHLSVCVYAGSAIITHLPAGHRLLESRDRGEVPIHPTVHQLRDGSSKGERVVAVEVASERKRVINSTEANSSLWQGTETGQ